MYSGLVASGVLIGLFGLFLVGVDFTVPLGSSLFGLPLLVVGVAMLLVGFFSAERPEIVPEPGMKFCWYCMKQIPLESKNCPSCSLPQLWE